MPEFYAFYLARILVVAVVTYLTIVFGELVPKRIGMCAPEVISKLAAVPMKAFSCVAALRMGAFQKHSSRMQFVGRQEDDCQGDGRGNPPDGPGKRPGRGCAGCGTQDRGTCI